MYMRKTTKMSKGKTYTHYLLVESVHTPKGPRQRTICSLGRLGPGPLEQWHALARKVEAALAGHLSLEPTARPMESLIDKAPPSPQRPGPSTAQGPPVAPEQVALEEAREAGLGVYLNRHQGMALLERVQASNLSDADRALVTRLIRATLKLPDDRGHEPSAPEAPDHPMHTARRRHRHSA